MLNVQYYHGDIAGSGLKKVIETQFCFFKPKNEKSLTNLAFSSIKSARPNPPGTGISWEDRQTQKRK